MTHSAARLAAYGVALNAAHTVADHWIQTQPQADHKGDPGWRGRLACLAHIGTYTATAALALVAVDRCTGLRTNPGRMAAGLALSAATHYIADRRTPLKRIANATGSGRFYTLGACRPDHDDNPTLGTGAYALDQSWHLGWIFVSALVAASGKDN